MTLDAIIVGFAFSAGAIAFLNPCGFAMLPTYVSYFVERNSQLKQETIASNSSNTLDNSVKSRLLISARRLIYSASVALLVTMGFVAIFGLTGLAISVAGTTIAKYFPWIAVLSGIVIIGIGIAKLIGKTFHINFPFPKKIIMFNDNTTGSDDNKRNNNYNRNCSRIKSSYSNFFLFGIGYAIASLSCTLPIFLLVVLQGLSVGGIIEGSIVFLSYALGMGIVMITISLAIGISNQRLVKWLTRIAPKMSIVTSIVLILAGGYLIYYNIVIGKLLST
ncbi:MAG: cytochrome c biogenesis CcdA family protein [Nitrososphaeraceae archaeon]